MKKKTKKRAAAPKRRASKDAVAPWRPVATPPADPRSGLHALPGPLHPAAHQAFTAITRQVDLMALEMNRMRNAMEALRGESRTPRAPPTDYQAVAQAAMRALAEDPVFRRAMSVKQAMIEAATPPKTRKRWAPWAWWRLR